MNASEIKRERESEGKAPSFNAQEAIGYWLLANF
jgi:hypothetical protein